MGKGIAVTVTRTVETREPRPGERWVSVWNGTAWVGLSSRPYSPGLAWIYGQERRVRTTRLEFLPPGTVPLDALAYRRGLLREMVRRGVVRA